jgi:hypothetical protein
MKLNRSILAAVVVVGAAAAMTGCNGSADQDQDQAQDTQAQVADAKEQVGAASTESFNTYARWSPRGERAREVAHDRREIARDRRDIRRVERRERENGWHPWRRFRAWWGR